MHYIGSIYFDFNNDPATAHNVKRIYVDALRKERITLVRALRYRNDATPTITGIYQREPIWRQVKTDSAIRYVRSALRSMRLDEKAFNRRLAEFHIQL